MWCSLCGVTTPDEQIECDVCRQWWIDNGRMTMDGEARKKAALTLARELYELMPDAPAIDSMPWDMLETTKHYNFCRLIAEQIIKANTSVFKS